MATIDRKEARAIVDGLRKRNGGLTAEQRERIDKEDLEMIENLREQLGGSVQRSRCRTEKSCMALLTHKTV